MLLRGFSEWQPLSRFPMHLPVHADRVLLAMSVLDLLATWIPAQRALSLDPVTLLREE